MMLTRFRHYMDGDRTGLLLAYTALVSIAKLFAFGGTGLVDTVFFLALLASLHFATSWKVKKWACWLSSSAVMFLVLPMLGFQNSFYFDIAIQVAMFAVLALGLNIVVGFAGLLDLGYVAFFAIGAYLWAILGSSQGFVLFGNSNFPLSSEMFFICAFAALALTALAGMLLGLPVLRLKGDYLAIVTLGLGEVIRVLANNLDKPVNITNGPQGIAGISQPLGGLAAFLATREIPAYQWQACIYYLIVIGVLSTTVFFFNRLDRSKIGRAWLAIKEDELAAQAMGVPLVTTKLIAFATGASVAGVVGTIFAAKQTFISPESFDFNQSIGILAIIVLGGLGSMRGAIVGATLVTILNLQVLKALSSWIGQLRNSGYEILGFSFASLPQQFEPAKYERLIFGLILIAMMLYRPQGLIPSRRTNAKLLGQATHGMEKDR
ncbi:MAG: hypothetical protein K8F25_11585 [Fimbriimonadaceae bacterium]|nr:hypothetical protein [Alphaproteobacteria bacterium]